MHARGSVWTSRVLLGLALAAAGVLSWRIDRNLNAGPFSFTLENALYRILGSAQEAVGDTLFLKADAYYHGGQTTQRFESREELEREGVIEKAAEGRDWIARVNSRIRSDEHRHLTREEQNEMLPFFALATALNPHNVEAALTTAYWLDRNLGKTARAVEVLQKARVDNPDAWEIDFNLADLYFRQKDYTRSEYYYRGALRKSSVHVLERHFQVDLHYYLAEACFLEGRKPEALREYQKALDVYGGFRTALRDKIEERIRELSASLEK